MRSERGMWDGRGVCLEFVALVMALYVGEGTKPLLGKVSSGRPNHDDKPGSARRERASSSRLGNSRGDVHEDRSRQ